MKSYRWPDDKLEKLIFMAIQRERLGNTSFAIDYEWPAWMAKLWDNWWCDKKIIEDSLQLWLQLKFLNDYWLFFWQIFITHFIDIKKIAQVKAYYL